MPRRFLERRTSNQSIEVHGDVALVVGRLDVRVAGSDSETSCYAVQYVHLYASSTRRCPTVACSRRRPVWMSCHG
jgi:hypothetical protein